MSFSLHGLGVSSGIAIGYAHLLSRATLEVAHYVVPKHEVREEITRFDAAVTATRRELESLHGQIPANAPTEFGAFLILHLMILNDPTLSSAPRQIIEEQQCNAEWALRQQLDALLEQFAQMDDSYLRERRVDVVQVVERVLAQLQGTPRSAPPPPTGEEALVMVAHDLSPADVILFKQHPYAAFITDLGGVTSHTAILARSLNIPAVVALHHARDLITENDLLIVDGRQGVVIVNPDQQVLNEYKLRRSQWETDRQKLRRLRSKSAVTKDGVPVDLMANIELPEDVERARESGAGGIGLFRSEFLFLNRKDLPSEEEQFDAYRRVAEQMHGQPVVIRTLDVGADKHLMGSIYSNPNPALGLRAIRLCLAEPKMFHTQLRAILRASHFGEVSLMIPMLTSLSELSQALFFIEQAKRSLAEEDVPFDPKIKVGGMVEVPAAALAIHAFVKKLDFVSIGTNDLIQYTLAIDRSDDSTTYLYDPLHPAVLRLVAETISVATKAKVPVAVCGEMAGEVALTRLLLGFGLRQFSMHPNRLPSVKQQVLKTNLADTVVYSKKMLKVTDPDEMQLLLAQMND